MDKQALQAQIAALTAEIDAAFKVADDAKRAMTADELAGVTATEAKIDAAKAEIANLEAAEQARLRNQQRQAEAKKSAGVKAGRQPVITSQKEAFEDDPKKGFKTPADFLMLIMESSNRGRVEDNRLRYLAVGSDEQGTYSDPYGNFLLPAAFSPNLLSLPPEVDPIGPRTTKVPMASATVNIPARTDKNHTSSVSGGLRVYRRQETDDVPSSRMEFEQVQLNAHSLFGVAYATEELLARSPISFVSLLEAGFGDEFGAKLVKERLFGLGAGEYEGIANSPAIVSIGKESGQAAATLSYANVVKMRARCWRYSQAIWLANHDVLPQLMTMSVAVGTGGSAMIWQPSARDGEPDILLGRPIYFSEYCKTLGTTGDIFLCNWSQYLEGTLSPVQSAESMHVRFLNHERTFKFWTENDGRGWWRAALTVNQGSNSLSPFIKLDTR